MRLPSRVIPMVYFWSCFQLPLTSEKGFQGRTSDVVIPSGLRPFKVGTFACLCFNLQICMLHDVSVCSTVGSVIQRAQKVG